MRRATRVGLVGGRRPVFWQNGWRYLDIDDGAGAAPKTPWERHMKLILFRRLAAWATCAAAACASAQPAPAGPIDHPSVAQALAALQAKDGTGTVVTQADGWVIVSEPAAAAQWSFTPSGHDAHPAVVRRVVRRDPAGAVSVETTSLCEAPAEACARLLQQFEAMNARITQALRARGRQGSTQP